MSRLCGYRDRPGTSATTKQIADKGQHRADPPRHPRHELHDVVDIGASNVEELLALMHKYRGSHEDFGYFVIPTVPALKQQQDTIATLAELAGLGIASSRLQLVFSLVEDGADVTRTFDTLLAFIEQNPLTHASTRCCLTANEIATGSHQ